jgi:hypothetical protein
MIDITAWVAAGAGLLGTAAAAVKVDSLLRTYLRQRTYVQLERERSARSIVRAAGLTRILHQPRATVRMVERDVDGERLIEIGQPDRNEERAA